MSSLEKKVRKIEEKMIISNLHPISTSIRILVYFLLAFLAVTCVYEKKVVFLVCFNNSSHSSTILYSGFLIVFLSHIYTVYMLLHRFYYLHFNGL